MSGPPPLRTTLAMDAGHALAFPVLIHGACVLGGLLLYVVTTRLRHQRRSPSTAFAWVITIALLPYVGIPLFLLFGTSKLARQHQPRPRPLPSAVNPLPEWAATLLAGLGLAPATGNASVRFHADGQEAQVALMEVIGAARRRILLSTFILGADHVGDAIVSALTRRASDGVEVCILLDALARLDCKRAQLCSLRAAGIGVRWVTSWRRNPLDARLNLRYHRKMVICDGAVLWSGGRNFRNEYFLHDGAGSPWEDLSFDIRGPLAAQAELLFEADWHAAGGARLAAEHAACARGDALAQLVPSGPDYADDNVYAIMLEAAFQARRRIVAVTPYFVPDEALLVAWRMARRRGVRITLLVPARSNHRLADWARGRALRDLCAAGAEIYLFPRMIHAKAVIVDDALALCGSANLDGRNLFLNFEMMVAFYGRAEITWLVRWVLARVTASARYQAHAPSWLRDVGEGVVRVIGFQL